MWFDSYLDLICSLRNHVPAVCLVLLPLIMAVAPVNSAQHFPVYRANQFDIASGSFGSRSTFVSLEARSIHSSTLTRRCIIVRLGELTLDRFRMLADKNAGALVVILPRDLGNMSAALHQEFLELEQLILTEEISFPVYFIVETPDLLDMYHEVEASSAADSSTTASEALLKSVAASGFQININVNSPKKLNRLKTLNIHGVLEGSGDSDGLPTLLFVAHYDSAGAVPGLSAGADSNGSGVAALLELMRLFSRLYSSPSTRPAYNLAFLASGAGKLNYFGTKRWLEDVKDSGRFPYIHDVEMAVCLDSLGKGSPLKVHVSKPPKENSPGAHILQNLEEIAREKGTSAQMTHKKIFLNDPLLAWEHEQFAMNKISGMTVSTSESHKDPMRSSTLDTRSGVSLTALTNHVGIIGEAVVRYIFNLDANETASRPDVFVKELAVQPAMIDAWMDLLTSEPRSAHFNHPDSSVVSSLQSSFGRYLKSVETTSYECDQRDPEFVLYGSSVETMYIYVVKPAVFDLVLALAITAYLGLFYLLSQGFPGFVAMINGKSKRS